MFVFGLLSLLVTLGLPILVVVLVVRARSARSGRPIDGASIRRFFQYLLLHVLMVVAVTGVADLFGRAVGGAPATTDEGELARVLAFAILGVPMAAGVAAWTRRGLLRDPGERASVAWALYLTAASLTALGVAAAEAQQGLAAAFAGRAEAAPLVRALVWLSVWVLHVVLGERTLTASARAPHLAAGSLVGLGLTVTGLVQLGGTGGASRSTPAARSSRRTSPTLARSRSSAGSSGRPTGLLGTGTRRRTGSGWCTCCPSASGARSSWRWSGPPSRSPRSVCGSSGSPTRPRRRRTSPVSRGPLPPSSSASRRGGTTGGCSRAPHRPAGRRSPARTSTSWRASPSWRPRSASSSRCAPSATSSRASRPSRRRTRSSSRPRCSSWGRPCGGASGDGPSVSAAPSLTWRRAPSHGGSTCSCSSASARWSASWRCW